MKRIVLTATLLFLCSGAWAQTKLTVRGAGKLYPIALPQLCLRSGQSDAVKEIPAVMARDLELSGYFNVIDPNAYIETPGKCTGPDDFAYSDWSVIGVDGLVRGVVEAEGARTKVQLYLNDVQIRKVVLGKEYEGDAGQMRRIGHRFANEIIKFFTGQAGVFGTQIAFVGKVGRFKELFVMDMDGSNVRQLTNDSGLAISNSRKLRQVTAGPGLEIGAKFNGDGSQLLVSRTLDRSSEIVSMNTGGTVLKRVTSSTGVIDVSPDWSPDYSRIVFCSNRGGGPQIYTMNADGSAVKRISYVSSSYCTSPKWAPKGDRVVFVCRADRGFQIFTANSDGSNPLQLTSYGNNEDPDWSPDGRYIVFATTFGKGPTPSIAMMTSDGGNIQQLTFSRSGDSEPVWGPVVQ
jgi:TolB protein